MKKFILFFCFILASFSFFAQVGMVFNDTIIPFGPGQTGFYHILSQDSCYYVEGYKRLNPKAKFFIKFDTSGNIIKKKIFDPSIICRGGRGPNSVILTNKAIINASLVYDSIYMSKAAIMALDFNLDTIWTRRYSNQYFSNSIINNYFDDIKETIDGGFLISGHYADTAKASDAYPYLMQIDSIGNIKWIKKYNYPNSYFYRIELTSDYGILIQAHKNDACMIKMNSKGDFLWEKKLNKPLCSMDAGNMSFAGNNNYIIASPYIYDYDNYRIWFGIHLCKINASSGQILWDTSYIPFYSFWWHANMKIHMMNNGSFKVSATAQIIDTLPNGGYLHEVGVVFSYSSNGDSLHTQFFEWGNQYPARSWLFDLIITNKGQYLGVGSLFGIPWFFKTMPNTMGLKNITTENPTLSVFPNPTKDYCYIKSPSNDISDILIFDIQGRLIKQINPSTFNNNLIKVNTTGFKPGGYFIIMKGKDKIYRNRIIIQ